MSQEKKNPREITLMDIAKELNVAKSTVSRALKNHPSIGEETKKAVRDLAKKYKYQPNTIAYSLAKNKTNTIGIIVPLLSHYFFSTVISGIEEVAYKEGYKVMIFQSAESYEREVEIAKTLLTSKVDGLLISISRQTKNVDHLLEFKEKHIPIVFFDRISPLVETDSVLVDDYKGAFIAVEHLINQGYKHILHLSAPPSLLISKNRLQGYLDAMKKYKLPVKSDWVIECGFERKHGVEAANKILQNGKLPEAIFSICDPVAIGLILTLKQNGVRIPDDIAVVGFNDDPTATVIEPHLTTILQPAFDMGEAAAEICLNQIKNKRASRQQVFEPKLIVRDSSIRKKRP